MAVNGCLKCMFIVINLLLCLAGVLVFSVSVWMYANLGENLPINLDGGFLVPMYILMATSFLMILVGFLGCCGAINDSPCMLGSFSAFLFLIVVAEIAGAAYAWSNHEEAKKSLLDKVTNMITNDYGIISAATSAVDKLHTVLECCGAQGTGDWLSSIGTRNANDLPDSCCKETGRCNPHSEVYSEGCVRKLEDQIERHFAAIVIAGIIIGILQIFGFVFSLVLCCRASKYDARPPPILRLETLRGVRSPSLENIIRHSEQHSA